LPHHQIAELCREMVKSCIAELVSTNVARTDCSRRRRIASGVDTTTQRAISIGEEVEVVHEGTTLRAVVISENEGLWELDVGST